MARVKKTVAKSSAAKNHPVIKSNIVSSADLPVAPEATLSFTDGKLNVEALEVVTDIYGFKDRADTLAFFEEPVTIIISEGTEKDAERYVFLANNGIGAGPNNTPWVPRGVEVTIKRKYLNELAGARPVKYKPYEFIDQNGFRHAEQRASSADIYPFQVVEDQNPRGRDWLKQLRASRRAG